MSNCKENLKAALGKLAIWKSQLESNIHAYLLEKVGIFAKMMPPNQRSEIHRRNCLIRSVQNDRLIRRKLPNCGTIF